MSIDQTNIGDVFERAKRLREVVAIEPQPGMIHWKRPGSAAVRQCWCVTWEEWAREAKLVRTAVSKGAEA